MYDLDSGNPGKRPAHQLLGRRLGCAGECDGAAVTGGSDEPEEIDLFQRAEGAKVPLRRYMATTETNWRERVGLSRHSVDARLDIAEGCGRRVILVRHWLTPRSLFNYSHALYARGT